VLNSIKQKSLFLPGDTLVAAVSGGPDSIAMLHTIYNITAGWNVRIHVAHLNHMFRGKQSEEEACFVFSQAEKLGLKCTVESFDVPAYIKESGLSPEDGARRIRYRFLQRVAKEIGASVIVTAHHANDQAETVLLHLLRGAGPEGLAAMAPKEGNLVRPLLEVTKEDILQYCREKNLTFRLDPTNYETDYLRNKVRLELIPTLKEYNPRIIESLGKTADICRNENSLLQALTEDIRKPLDIVEKEGSVTVSVSRLQALHPALQRRLLRSIVDGLAEFPGSLSFRQTEEIIRLNTGKRINLPRGICAYREYDKLTFYRHSLSLDRENPIPVSVVLKIPGVNVLPQLNIIIEAGIKSWPHPDFARGKYSVVLNKELTKLPLVVRTRRPGDRFQPAGLKGTKKIKDFFIDEKIPRNLRDRIPLLVSDDKILWIIGYRLAEGVEVFSGKQQGVVIEVKKLSGA